MLDPAEHCRPRPVVRLGRRAAAGGPAGPPRPEGEKNTDMLTIFEAGRLIMRLSGGWLYPLWALYFATGRDALPLFSNPDLTSAIDTKIGRGAVFLYAGLGIGEAHGKVVSALAQRQALHFGIRLTHEHVVDSLECMTETLLDGVWDREEGLSILETRVREGFWSKPRDYVEPVYIDDMKAARVSAYLRS